MAQIQKTYAMKACEIDKKWILIDAQGKVVGRLASTAAEILSGKKKPSYSPYLDMGDYVIIINAEKAVLTGMKGEDKDYFSHSGYPGGVKFTSIKKIRESKPEFILEHAIKGMLPKSRLGKKMFGNLKVYCGDKHPHEAQQPEMIEI